ncbi:unnamed protein product [Blepharisma stoltei]|uniref:RING-type domain-containing protein n=1 Tax=Blepharisma stoltei TaxID=1481888 RepID=A0AAU9J3N1_9CILI|nr:unnamed protein product [Blepharisma stoltei]
MTEYCNICCIQESSSNFLTLSCGCYFCKTSTSQWILAQLDKFYQADFQITCPLGFGHILSEEDIKKCLTKHNYQVYENFTLKRELIRDPVFKQCPSKNCNYVGWIDPKATCKSLLQCPKCKNKWIDPSLKPKLDRLKDAIYEMLRGESDFWSYTWEELWVKHCPKCGSPIEKNGGCYHMTCVNCAYEFCWDCLQPYRNHVWKYCGLNQLYCWGLTIIMIFLFFCKITILSDMIYDLMIFILWKLLYLIAGIAGIWPTGLSIALAYDYFHFGWLPCSYILYWLLNIGIAAYLFIGFLFLQEFTLEVLLFAFNIGISFLICLGGGFSLYVNSLN